MKRCIILLVMAISMVSLCACDLTTDKEPVPSHAPVDAFVWQPADLAPYGADTANCGAYGMADARNGAIYFQHYPYNTLCSLGAQGQIQELAEECGGMINASDDAV